MAGTSFFKDATFPLGPFVPYKNNPILKPLGGSWESANLYNPAALVVDDEVVLLYRAHADDIVSHIGIAHSKDGYSFERESSPILSPTEDYERYGCEDPRITAIDGTYYLTYTGWDRARAQLCLATSTDLHHWTKHGPMFENFDTFAVTDSPTGGNWNKAGVILPFQIEDKWWMYFGEGSVYWATSDDLLHWTPGTSDKEPIYRPMEYSFDADLVEIGAPPVLTSNGLLLFLANGATRQARPDGTYDVDYRCGQFVIDPDKPREVLARMTTSWLHPQTFEEVNGLIPNVTFVEGLVYFHDLWFAYYGQSDTTLATAVFDPKTTWGQTLNI
ncbi:glycoside hydrolase family 130 protein [Bifidobacterium aquikefiri]|uniref:glycoside hydrolase family 130 protein n=1 Tax=Bifidobacterium aquikefiri TaxID=1653207 RepID=UPI0039E86F62